MLKLVEESHIEDVLGFLASKDGIAVRIGAYLSCYRTEMDFAYFWAQHDGDRIVTVVSKIDGDMTVCSTDETNFEELSEFINVIGYSSLFMHLSDFERMSLEVSKSGNILKLFENRSGVCEERVTDQCDLKNAFNVFNENSSESIVSLEYLPWLSDFTYKRNRNAARIKAIEKDGRQICFAMTSAEINSSALISGVVTDKAYRKRGYASYLVSFLADELVKENKSVYIMTATEINRKFYEKNGFICVGKWGQIDRKI